MQSEQFARHQREDLMRASALSIERRATRRAGVAPAKHHPAVRERAPPRHAAILVETAVSNLERRRVDDGGTS